MRRRFSTCIALAAAILFFENVAVADTPFDPLIGIRVGQGISNNILASPPLPRIAGEQERSERHLSPLVSYTQVKVGNSDPTSSPGYSGSFTGYSAGLGFTHDSKAQFSYYGFATFSQTKGDIKQTGVDLSQTGTSLTDVENTGMNLSLGASRRLWSEKDFPLVVGLIGGPYFSSYSSKMTATTPDPDKPGLGPQRYPVSSQILSYGILAGVQSYIKIGGLAINPYFLYYKDLSDTCRTFETEIVLNDTRNFADPAHPCSSNYQIYLDGTFYAYGLILGYHGFSAGVLAKTQDIPELSSLVVQNYTLSYTFDF